jgi:hypothetical protein
MFTFGVPVDAAPGEDEIVRKLTPYLGIDPGGLTWLMPIVILNGLPVPEEEVRRIVRILASVSHPVSGQPLLTRWIVGNEPGSSFFPDLAAYPAWYRLCERVIREEVADPWVVISPAGISDGALRGAVAGDPRGLEIYRAVEPLAGNVITFHHHSAASELQAFWPLRNGRMVWLTEAGYPEPQAVRLIGNVAALESLQATGAADYLRLALGLPGALLVQWSPVQDSGLGDRWDGVGIYRVDGAEKPAAEAIRQVAAEIPAWVPA